MHLILCHTTADFDTLGAAVGLARLHPGARIVLTGGCHPTVQRFVALHRDEYPLIERRAVDPDQLTALTLVDAQQPQRFGPAAEWIARAQRDRIPISIYDHHAPTAGTAVQAGDDGASQSTPLQQITLAPVGAATTLVVEALQQSAIKPTVAEATVMALGIHVDTGSLLFEQTTARDARALAWLMDAGASLPVIAEFVEPGLSPQLQDLLTTAMDHLTVETVEGYGLGVVLLSIDHYVPGLSGLAERLIALADLDGLLLGAHYPGKEPTIAGDSRNRKLLLIGRAQGQISRQGLGSQGIDWGWIFTPLGGGGHATAASVTLTTEDPAQVVAEVMAQLRSQIPQAPTARQLMSSPVRTIRPETTMAEAQRILLRYGHSGLSVVDASGQLVGMISRRDLDRALHHGFTHAPVKGYMATNLKTITPQTSVNDIEDLMVTYDIGRLPVLDQGQLVGIVSRTDLLRHRHQTLIANGRHRGYPALAPAVSAPILTEILKTQLPPDLSPILEEIAIAAQARGWHLYLVGGAVRDLLLGLDGLDPLPAIPNGPSPRSSNIGAARGNGSNFDGSTQSNEVGQNSYLAFACTNQLGPQPSGQSYHFVDLDLVVDGGTQGAQAGAGVQLAEQLKDTHPEVDIQVHGRFQTASLVWHHDLAHPLAGLILDIATARTEFYPYPAANPEVEPSSIQQDLYRRDFTINAMALRLTEPGRGELLDYFGGLMDLRQRLIKVLHPNSFIEDPTRIFRAVRFAVRLGFNLDPQTEGYIQHAIDSGIYTQMQRQVKRVPALQVRLKNELQYILESVAWPTALARLDQLRALRCLYTDLAISPTLWQQLRRLSRWLDRFAWPLPCRPWEMRLQVLLGAVPAVDRQIIATALRLTDSSIARLSQLDVLEQTWLEQLAQPLPPSQVYDLFRQSDRGTLLLIGVRYPRRLGPLIWRYLTQWMDLAPLLNGDQLKALGYQPGPGFRTMLKALLAAQIDGLIENCSQAEEFITTHYPLDGQPLTSEKVKLI
jgi:tRNA nucleotidyltransferase (CCA-adding enzyme)